MLILVSKFFFVVGIKVDFEKCFKIVCIWVCVVGRFLCVRIEMFIILVIIEY